MSNKNKKSAFQEGWLASVSMASILTVVSISARAEEIDIAQENVKNMVYLPFRCKNWRIDIYKKFSLFSIDNHQIS